jgi:hypothetical protein
LKPGDIFDLMFTGWSEPVYEPAKRNKDGLRWIRHRFPIKGGITLAEVMRRDMMEAGSLFTRLTANGLTPVISFDIRDS